MVLGQRGADLFLDATMSLVATEIYARASRRKFNHVGGLKFEADVGAIIAVFTQTAGVSGTGGGSSGAAVREKFAKLSQMAFILSMETSMDIAECWMEGGLAKPPITQKGVRRIAGLRSDFAEGEAEGLVLS